MSKRNLLSLLVILLIREGEAGHTVLPRGTTEGTPGTQTVSPQLR